MPTVQVLSAEQFAPLVPAAATIYGAAMQRNAATVAARQDLIRTHLGRPRFAAVTASRETTLIGFGYGYEGRPGQWWYDVVAAALGRQQSATWLHDPFELAELHVEPSHHGNGTGREILQTLLDASAGTTVVLSTPDRDSPARRLYRSVGFVDLIEGFRFPGSAEVYAVMGLSRQ